MTETWKAVESLTYEEAYAELEQLVQRLEAGQQPLDEAIRLFERGQALIRHCQALLDQAELRVRELDRSLNAEAEEPPEEVAF
ncbi:MAG: exodeoxyribonuclease VII small subunit [Thermanaerothrix sp.]|jgi:exodeoxyribonuclease VII small subunit|uniref:Exodeoxyribonuclease 7 small subunit n=1 Tax=Thermanaerothrix solaris TaxID=3058434 RepID=A0ABU3NN77_9CHLR|nr:exodeoxyribonuclease VII small subunit [Thermanaerothrix sp. 4228-RoL]MDT8898305.1 exodeoxyribonuclease VII small subunit [Thermanaerothrix sp. 4228-RoL]